MKENKHETAWNQNFEVVKTFCSANKRWPSTTSEDASEKKLAQWWSRQKFLLNSITESNNSNEEIMPTSRVTLVRNLVESNSNLERSGIWDSRFSVVSEKFKADGRLWTLSQCNEEETKILRWWNQQKTFAKKFKTNPESCGGMTQERLDKVESLMRLLSPATTDSVVVDNSNAPANESVS